MNVFMFWISRRWPSKSKKSNQKTFYVNQTTQINSYCFEEFLNFWGFSHKLFTFPFMKVTSV